MYRLEYGSAPNIRRLYIFKTEDGETFSDTVNWKAVIGSESSVNLRYDAINKNGIFTPIIKTSLEVQFIRENDTEFLDLIASEEGEFWAVVLEGGELDVDVDGDITITGTGAKMLFKGVMSNETFGEAYLPVSTVGFTFHDRLGDLSEKEFFYESPQMAVADLLGDILAPLPSKANLYFEFPFDIQTATEKNLKHPGDLFLDVSEYYGSTHLAILKDFLETFKLQLVCDFDYVGSKLNNSGRIRIRFPKHFDREENSYYSYSWVSGVYTLEGIITETLYALAMNSSSFPIISRSGRWGLVRKAPYIQGTNIFVFKEGLVNPNPFDERYINNVEPEEDYNDYDYPFTSQKWKGIYNENPDSQQVQIEKSITIPSLQPKAFGAVIGNENKIGFMIRDARVGTKHGLVSEPILVQKRDELMDITFEVHNSHPTSSQVSFYLYANYKGTLYQYSKVTETWITPTNLWSGWDFAGFDGGKYVELTANDIPHPTGIGIFKPYYLFIWFDVSGLLSYAEGEYFFLTGFNIQYQKTPLFPAKLVVTTNLGETRRKPIRFESKFYNLPYISGAEIFMASGILAKNLELYAGGILQETNSDTIVAPATFEFEGNNGTILVHSTDIVGLQHNSDLWRFEAEIKRTGKGPIETVAVWDSTNYVCELEETS